MMHLISDFTVVSVTDSETSRTNVMTSNTETTPDESIPLSPQRESSPMEVESNIRISDHNSVEPVIRRTLAVSENHRHWMRPRIHVEPMDVTIVAATNGDAVPTIIHSSAPLRPHTVSSTNPYVHKFGNFLIL